MDCEKCKSNMNRFLDKSAQGWICPKCGWNIITTKIDEIFDDMTEYSIYINDGNKVNIENMKLISKIAGVNFIIAKQMLTNSDTCLLKAKAPRIKEVIEVLKQNQIYFEVMPRFKY